ncbi:MAG: hypothetical protein A2469_04530 [Candidatus Magasanikbacteria bacterium RIFOXYC2_FULL_40_16]|uniref:Uncharacterized protein n=1 Tax=Candidatus Magasanikbacteria bacterium RIFOXYC2_FULL_40_16 TaxID=1798703 RepID=A0A1F6NZU4_9BACT|nr:MAG: hypothetical protein A2469_04530 [Candidatus Magasanikbacteria bacterium RIFOXYC2_FULL_40_16]
MAKYDGWTYGETEALLNIIGGADVARKVLRGESKLTVVEIVPQPLLTLAGTVKVQPVNKLGVNEFFNENNSSVRISYVGDNFKEWFYGKEEEQPNANETVLRYHTLNRRSVDGPIIKELGGEDKVKVTLSHVAALMLEQSNGERGALLTNSYADIFYVHDVAVNVYWLGFGWYVVAYSVGDPGGWNAGGRVFSCDS